MKKNKIIIIKESAIESWLRDASTLALFVVLIGIGIFLESSAMQWIGAIIGFFVVISKSAIYMEKRSYTIDEAEAEIQRLKAEG